MAVQNFPKTGEVRIDQLRHEINRVAEQQGFQFPDSTIHWTPASEMIRIKNATTGMDANINVEALALQYKTPLQNLINAHVPSAHYFPWEKREINFEYLLDKIGLSQLADKTPQQIYTGVQAQIDGWTSLAMCKADLREWMPLLFAAVIYMNFNKDS